MRKYERHHWKNAEECNQYWKRYRLAHSKKYQKEKTKEFKSKIYQLLGGKCIICGYIGLALQIDHVKDNGYEERRKYRRGNSSYKYYRRILDLILSGSKDYQLLCANHNWEKRHNIIVV